MKNRSLAKQQEEGKTASKHCKLLSLLHNVSVGSTLFLKQKTLKKSQKLWCSIYSTHLTRSCVHVCSVSWLYLNTILWGLQTTTKIKLYIRQMMVYHCEQCTVNHCFVIYLMHQVATAMCVFHSLFFHSGFEHHSRLHSEKLWLHCTNK